MNISVFSVQISQRIFATLALFGVLFAPFANVQFAYAANVFTSSFELGATGNSSITSDNGWSLANNDWIITSGSGHSGSRKVQVSDQGASDDILRKNYSTVGKNTVVLSYYYKTGQPLEANDHVYVEWTANGSTWTQLADYKSISNGSWTAASFNLPAGANNNANFAFRFRAVGLEPSIGGGDKDEFQLDTVNLSTENIPVDVCSNLEGNQSTVPEGYIADGSVCSPVPVDVCPNLGGTQATVPEGYILTDGQCVVVPPPPTDVCPNLDGAQATVPEGYILTDGQCVVVPPPTDVCTNIEGDQASLPEGNYFASAGICLPNPVDACTNIEGLQVMVPEGYTADGGICTLPPPDVCPNIEGAQTTVPEGMQIADGQCIPIPPPDVCPNLDGAQGTVPEGYVLTDGQCVEVPPPPVDACPNIEGDQATVPEGMQIADGQCIPIPPPDVCPNLDGAQGSVPEGYVLTDGQCVVIPPTDVCPNIEGDQATVPEGYLLSDNQCVVVTPPADVCTNIEGDQASLPEGNYFASAGICLPNPVDACTNIEGLQTTVPEGYILNDGQCVVSNTDDEEDFDRYTLDITITGDGEGNVQAEESITCFSEGQENDCSDTYPAGTVVILVATPNEGSNFDNSWTVGAGTCTGNTSPCTVTMNSNYSLTAHFDLNSSGGSGNGGTRVKRNGNTSLGAPSSLPLTASDELTDILPVGAPNTGAGGTSNTVALPILLAILEASREVKKK